MVNCVIIINFNEHNGYATQQLLVIIIITMHSYNAWFTTLLPVAWGHVSVYGNTVVCGILQAVNSFFYVIIFW